MNAVTKYLGILFVFLGILFLADNLNIVSLNWSLYIILIGLVLILGYVLKNELAIFLLPGVMLFIYGLIFLYCSYSDWQNMIKLWPLLFIAPGIGFLLLYFLKNKETYYWTPGVLFIIFGILFFVRKMAIIKFWPLLLLALGLVMLYRFYKAEE